MALLRRLLLTLIGALLTSCSVHLPSPPEARAQTVIKPTRSEPLPSSSSTVPVYLLSDNLHTALVFDREWLEASGFVLPRGVAPMRYLTMSWGDEVAYVQKRWLSPWQVFRALCTPSASVMECIPFDWKVEQVCLHQTIYVANVSRSVGPSLASFLNACSQKGPDGLPVTIGPSSWGEGRLIRCPENYTYYFPRICNVWTAQALQSMGMPFPTRSCLSASGLSRQATRNFGFTKIWDGGS